MASFDLARCNKIYQLSQLLFLGGCTTLEQVAFKDHPGDFLFCDFEAIASPRRLGRKNPVTMGMPFVMTLCIAPLLGFENSDLGQPSKFRSL